MWEIVLLVKKERYKTVKPFTVVLNIKTVVNLRSIRRIARKTLTQKNITDLLTKGKTCKIKGFKSKAGKSFEATLKLDDNSKIKFDFN